MLLTSSDNQVTRQITLVYCALSCVVLPLAVLSVFLSEVFLIAGSTKLLPLFIPFVIFELVKWGIHHIIYDKDLKVKKTNKFGALSILYRHIDVLEVLKGIVIYCLGTLLFFVVAVLFGAEIFSDHEQTLMFGALVSLLTVFPMTLHTGRQAFMKFTANQPAPNMFHKLFYRVFQFSIAGAWAGAVFIPLDWDRPWQAWPITCSFGGFVGHTFAYLFFFIQNFVFGSHGLFRAWTGAAFIPVGWRRAWQACPITRLIGAVIGSIFGYLFFALQVFGLTEQFGLEPELVSFDSTGTKSDRLGPSIPDSESSLATSSVTSPSSFRILYLGVKDFLFGEKKKSFPAKYN